jgi:hypothetical protein
MTLKTCLVDDLLEVKVPRLIMVEMGGVWPCRYVDDQLFNLSADHAGRQKAPDPSRFVLQVCPRQSLLA